MKRLSIVVVAALIGAGCRRDPGPPPLPPPPPLAVEFSGCAAVREGPVCELPAERSLQVWIQAPDDAAVAVDAGAGPIAPAGTAVQGGLLASLQVAEGAAAIVVTASRGGAAATFRLPLAPRAPAPELDEAEDLRRKGQLDEAEARVRDALQDPRPLVQLQAKRKLARIERARGRAERAAQLFEELIPLDRAAGRVSDEIDDRLALAFTYLFPSRRIAEARRALEGVEPLEPEDPRGRALTPYFRGLIASESGDLRAALRLFREAAERQERLGLAHERFNVLGQWADTLALLGRHDEALVLLREAQATLPPGTSACQKAALLNDLGWLALRAAESPSRGAAAPAADPIGPIAQAIALHRQHCEDPAALANYLTNLALAELARGRPHDARARLDEARRASPSPGPRVELWWPRLEGQIALAEGKPGAALEWFEQVEELGARLLLYEARFAGTLGRAQALDALGRVEPARAAYAEAEQRLDDWSRLVPLGEGRDTFLARNEQSARLRVDFLLRQPGAGMAEKAAAAARRSRSRLLRALGWVDRVGSLPAEERARWEASLEAYRREREALDAATASDWRLSKSQLAPTLAERARKQEQLRAMLEQALSGPGGRPGAATGPARPRAPAEGELLLVVHPVKDGWAGFAIEPRGVRARRLGALDPDAPAPQLATALLGPFDEEIARARRLRFAAYGALDRLDVHALPWRGRPLLAHAPLVYAADLSPREARPADEASALAVVVGDPRGDLPAARGEAETVAAALAGAGLRVEKLERAAATHAAVRDALERPETRLFHYAGHGVFEGRDGWESGLPLARGGWLTIGDITALLRVPEQVVLSGCETARTAETARAAGLGLAQAFLVAGADQVVAATRKVDDRLAARILARLYEDDAGGDLADALRRAQLAEIEANPASDWASFRVLSR